MLFRFSPSTTPNHVTQRKVVIRIKLTLWGKTKIVAEQKESGKGLETEKIIESPKLNCFEYDYFPSKSMWLLAGF